MNPWSEGNSSTLLYLTANCRNICCTQLIQHSSTTTVAVVYILLFNQYKICSRSAIGLLFPLQCHLCQKKKGKMGFEINSTSITLPTHDSSKYNKVDSSWFALEVLTRGCLVKSISKSGPSLHFKMCRSMWVTYVGRGKDQMCDWNNQSTVRGYYDFYTSM